MSVKGPFIAGITVAAATAIGATIIATSGDGSAAAKSSAGSASIQSRPTKVGGQTEDVLADGTGRPLYYFAGDTAKQSHVTGQLAVAWPPVTSGQAPAAHGLSGRLTTVHDAHGNQVAYNGHLLYTFVSDSRGVARGQGVQNFYLATPSLSAPPGSSPTSSDNAPAGGYGGY